jgi:hypothetical protein
MDERREGTFRLDGIIEGPVPGTTDGPVDLRRWASSATQNRIAFSLEVDGGTFSALAIDSVIEVAAVGSVDDAVSGQLDALLEVFPPAQRTAVFSTVRSMEYQPGAEIQTLYAVGPDGQIHTEQRRVDAQTTRPPEPLTGKEKIRVGLTVLMIFGVLFAVSTIFVDYRGMWENMKDKATSLNQENIEWVNPAYAPYFVVDKAEFPKRSVLRLTISRTEAFPTTSEELDALAAAAKTVQEGLVVDAIGSGYLRGEWADKEGKILSVVPIRIRGLSTSATIVVDLPVPIQARPTRFEITH